MDSCPGGGAEIFARRVRDIICKNKISGERWLEVARECHRQGVAPTRRCSTATSRRPRSGWTTCCGCATLQDETGGIPGPDPARVPSREHAARAPAALDRPARPARHRRVAPAARQRPAHQGLLDPDRRQARPGRALLRRRRPRRHGRRRDDHARRRRHDGLGLTRAEFERIIRESGREPFERDSEYRRVVRGGRAQPCPSARPGMTGGAGRRRARAARRALLAAAACATSGYKTKPRVARRRTATRSCRWRQPASFQSLERPDVGPAEGAHRSAVSGREGASESRSRSPPRMYPIGLLDTYEVVNDEDGGAPYRRGPLRPDRHLGRLRPARRAAGR